MEVNIDMPIINESSKEGMIRQLSKDFNIAKKDVRIKTPVRSLKQRRRRKRERFYNRCR